ncbi:Alpha/Beta hydrolase protein [Amylocarpus encephaloides]|uniref:Alpha/Beta hydrolase protein n=1 Tax=Amylocarpus encephaloides TaxID=45428 RepID=A0A9P8CAA6_9HELO|nr:Alpha/Beta hydrolase protein [Amylocarpus encephaloides]
MDEILALDKSVGRDISQTLHATFKIYTPHLIAHSSSILSTPRSTHPYGPDPRQLLDIYFPPSISPTIPNLTSTTPILIFLYGGGLILGNKVDPDIQDGLVYKNLGAFFAQRGIVTVIPDYRRADSRFGGEGARYPSGGEDVLLALKWVAQALGNGETARDVFLMGNSAGGVHVSTFLLADEFAAERKLYCAGKGGVTLRGAVGLAVPFRFPEALGRGETLRNYYGSLEKAEERAPCGLLERLKGRGSSMEEAGVPRMRALVGEFDPEDEISGPTRHFVELWGNTWGDGMEFKVLKGHNHASPAWALMAGEKEGELWAEDVVEWIKS